jgi:hypothetical protein
MANTRTIRREENAPIDISERAMDNLKYIRETMEHSTAFTAVPGYGGMLMGVTAAAAAYIAFIQADVRTWLIVWLTEATLAFAIGLLAMWQKSKATDAPLLSTPARKFARGFAPPLICGVMITLGLWRMGDFRVMIPCWLLLYGASVVAGGSYSVRVVPIMGWCFISLGAAAFFVPAAYSDAMMGLGFGLLHIVFGFIIARKFGG